MFADRSAWIARQLAGLYYGVAVTDIDGDGADEFFVAGFGFPNRVLKFHAGRLIDLDIPALADFMRHAIGVAAADIDGDGREEIYVLNSDTFSGKKRVADCLFDWQDGEWVDLFTIPENQSVLNQTAGRSVCAIDRTGNGRYGFLIANYGGPLRLYEIDDSGMLVDAAAEAGINGVLNGRGLISLPLVSDRMDIFAVNENGPNFLFVNRGDGVFDDMAEVYGLSDPNEHARGVSAFDANFDGRFDIVYGNWEGPHRLFVRHVGETRFADVAPLEMALPTPIRTVIAADFDNDGIDEIFFNNIGESNLLFIHRDGEWQPWDCGAAAEPDGLGTGAAVADIDGDGRLELLVAHGETGSQPLSLFQIPTIGHYLRIRPQTRFGAPARGAVVTLTAGTSRQIRTVDAGSGYLCQMEPVAHFGLKSATRVDSVSVWWPDGTTHTIQSPPIDQTLTVPYPR